MSKIIHEEFNAAHAHLSKLHDLLGHDEHFQSVVAKTARLIDDLHHDYTDKEESMSDEDFANGVEAYHEALADGESKAEAEKTAWAVSHADR